MGDYSTLSSLFTGIATSIRQKTGSTNPITATNFPETIASIRTSTDYAVLFIDYDGTVVESWTKLATTSKSALPANPSHTGLVAQGWNWTLNEIKSYLTSYPAAIITVGQLYKTSSGRTEFDVIVNTTTTLAESPLTITCNMVGNKTWGDGTSDSATSHTYAAKGTYTITCDGTAIPAGASGSNIFGQISNRNSCCIAIRLGENVTSIGSYAFGTCSSLRSISFPIPVQAGDPSTISLGKNAFDSCYSLNAVVIPRNIYSIESGFPLCRDLKYGALPCTHSNNRSINCASVFSCCNCLKHIVFPNNISSLVNVCSTCLSLHSITIPEGVTNLQGVCKNCPSLTEVSVPSTATVFTDAFYGCEQLKTVELNMSTLSTSCNNMFRECKILNSVTLPDVVTKYGSNMFYGCNSLKSLVISSSIIAAGIGTQAFVSNYSLQLLDFSNISVVPTLPSSSTISGIPSDCKIVVPDGLYNDFLQDSNWALLENYIYKASEV